MNTLLTLTAALGLVRQVYESDIFCYWLRIQNPPACCFRLSLGVGNAKILKRIVNDAPRLATASSPTSFAYVGWPSRNGKAHATPRPLAVLAARLAAALTYLPVGLK